MILRKTVFAVCFGCFAIQLSGKEATWTGDPWEPISRQRIMELADEMIDVTWSPRRTILNFRTPANPEPTRTVFHQGQIYRGIAYNMIHEADHTEGFLWKVNTTEGGLTEFGNDCSGFLSIAWRLPRRLNTVRFENEMMGPAILVRSLGAPGSGGSVELFRGDAFNDSGNHNLLFDRYAASGIISAEQTPGPRNVGVPHAEMRRNWSWSSLNRYRPMRRNLITDAADAQSTLFAAGDWARTTPASLNRRNGPGTSYAILGALPQNTLVRILPHQNNGVRLGTQRWWFAEVSPSGERGWLAQSYLVAVAPPANIPAMPVFALNTLIEGEGQIFRHPSQSDYVAGSEVELRAVGTPGWEFHKWEGDFQGENNPAIILVGEEKTVTARFRRSFDAWIESQFTFAEQRNPAWVTPAADPFGHGIPNLVAYALGLEARTPDRTLLPRLEYENGHLVFVFRRISEIADVTPTPEISSDLSAWAPLDPETFTWKISNEDPAIEEIRIILPETAEDAFLRLHLSRTP